jgi:2-phospho-L-lactate/phosphoenolpyruvate guanylyltransferase
VEWVLVVPVKRLALAKSRIGEPWAPYRAELALSFAQDTVVAALAAPVVAAVVVVTDDHDVAGKVTLLGAAVVPDVPDGGQNAAIRHGFGEATRRYAGAGVAALAADLPSLRGAELGDALAASAAYPACLVSDVAGTGTTLLTAVAGSMLSPQFGPRSRAAHRAAGAVELDGPWPSLRRDVDTVADLLDAQRLGVGPATSALLARLAATESG